MPIRPENRHRYPRDWRDLRRAILARAGDRCEGSPRYPECRAANYQPHPVTGARVVLTVAHLDWTEEHNDLGNLRALCQRCHNAHDAQRRRENARQRRAQEAGQDALPLG